MRSRPKWFYTQSAVVPYRCVGHLCEVLIITSRRGKRWTVPKGIVERDLTPAASAAKEAFEEAGVRGEVHAVALGSYEYEKWGGVCTVEVFAMRVDEVLASWPEGRVRRRQWLPIRDAAQAVSPESLRMVVSRLEDRMGADGGGEH